MNEAPPLAPEEVVAEPPAAYAPPQETPAETLVAASDPAALPVEAPEGAMVEPTPKKVRTRRRKAATTNETTDHSEPLEG